MINYESFSDEFQKIAVSKWRTAYREGGALRRIMEEGLTHGGGGPVEFPHDFLHTMNPFRNHPRPNVIHDNVLKGPPGGKNYLTWVLPQAKKTPIEQAVEDQKVLRRGKLINKNLGL